MSRKFGVEGSRQRVGMQVGKEVPKGGAGFRGKGRWDVRPGRQQGYWVAPVATAETRESRGQSRIQWSLEEETPRNVGIAEGWPFCSGNALHVWVT